VKIVVPPHAAGTRLDRFLADHVGSRGAAERAVETGVLVDGRPRPKSYRLEGGEELELATPAAVTKRRPGPNSEPELQVPYEDEHLLVVDKPAGLVVHPGAGNPSGTVVQLLAGKAGGGDDAERPGIVHRLDRDTSGLLVVAKDDNVYRKLTDLVRARGLERTYLALVHGRPRSRTGRIEAPIGRDRRDATRISLDTDTPRAAVTHFDVEQLWNEHALLRVRLETGRMHQIRVHLAAIDLPVVGDAVYGVRDERLGRQFLHATRLAFPHPVTGERVDVVSALPDDLRAFVDVLG
jgi:23S rRNA pseudouridine1911/1915/1917 synthase